MWRQMKNHFELTPVPIGSSLSFLVAQNQLAGPITPGLGLCNRMAVKLNNVKF